MLKLITMTWRPSRELTLGYCCFQNDLNFSHVWSQMDHLSGPYIRGSLLLWSWSLALLGMWTIVHILLIPYNNSFFTAGANYPTSHEGRVDRRTRRGLPQQYQGQKVSHSVALAYWSEVKMCSTLCNIRFIRRDINSLILIYHACVLAETDTVVLHLQSYSKIHKTASVPLILRCLVWMMILKRC